MTDAQIISALKGALKAAKPLVAGALHYGEAANNRYAANSIKRLLKRIDAALSLVTDKDGK